MERASVIMLNAIKTCLKSGARKRSRNVRLNKPENKKTNLKKLPGKIFNRSDQGNSAFVYTNLCSYSIPVPSEQRWGPQAVRLGHGGARCSGNAEDVLANEGGFVYLEADKISFWREARHNRDRLRLRFHCVRCSLQREGRSIRKWNKQRFATRYKDLKVFSITKRCVLKCNVSYVYQVSAIWTESFPTI